MRGVSQKRYICVIVTSGFVVSEWCFRSVESCCYIGIWQLQGYFGSSVFVTSLKQNVDFGESGVRIEMVRDDQHYSKR